MTEVFLTAAAARTRRAAHYHWRAPKRPYSPPPGSACGDHRLARDTGREPATVPVERRCRSRGCAERWAGVEHGPDLMSTSESAPSIEGAEVEAGEIA